MQAVVWIDLRRNMACNTLNIDSLAGDGEGVYFFMQNVLLMRILDIALGYRFTGKDSFTRG